MGVCVYYCSTYYKAVRVRVCVSRGLVFIYYCSTTYYKAVRLTVSVLPAKPCVCVYYCSTYYKAVRVGGGVDNGGHLS